MDKPHKNIRIVGERRAELDSARFVEALIAFALHRLQGRRDSAVGQPMAPAEPGKEAS